MQLLGSSDFCLVQVLQPPPAEAQLCVLILPISCQEKNSSEMIHLISQGKKWNLLKMWLICLLFLTSNLSQTPALSLTHTGQGIHLQVMSGSGLVRGSGVRHSPSPGHRAPSGAVEPWSGEPASLQHCCDRDWQSWGGKKWGPSTWAWWGQPKEMLGRDSQG